MINYSLVVFFLAPVHHLSTPQSKTRKLLNVFNMVVVNFPNDDCVSDSGTRGVSLWVWPRVMCDRRCLLHGCRVFSAGRGRRRHLRHGLRSVLHLQGGVRGAVQRQQHILLRLDQLWHLALLLQGDQLVFKDMTLKYMIWYLSDVPQLPRHLPVAAELRDVLCVGAELPGVWWLPGHGPHPVPDCPVLRPLWGGAPAHAVRHKHWTTHDPG